MDVLSQQPLTAAFVKAGLAAGTTTTISTTATVQYCIRGKAYSKAAITNGATPTTDAATGLAFPALSANQACVVLIGFNAAGSVLAVQGSTVAMDSGATPVFAPSFGTIPDNFCPIGYIVLKAGSTLASTFTFGTNNLSGVTGMTYTFVDLMTLPDRPQIS